MGKSSPRKLFLTPFAQHREGSLLVPKLRLETQVPKLRFGLFGKQSFQNVRSQAELGNEDASEITTMHLNYHHFLSILALCALAALLAADEPISEESPAKALLRKSFLGQTPPEIVSEKAHWLAPPHYTKLEQLHGKVVWLQFNF